MSAEHLGPYDYYYWDDFWSLRGLLDAATELEALGRAGDARAAADEAEGLRRATFSSLDLAARRIGRRAMPAGPRRGLDPGMIGSLAACAPLALLAADDPRVRETLEVVRERFTVGDAFFQSIYHAGMGTYLTLQLAEVELRAGDAAGAWRRLRWLLDAATDTFTWPEAIHPRLGGGCVGDGHHGWAAADFLSFVRNALVREDGDGLALMSAMPPDWAGRQVAVQDAPTHHGRVSFELGWSDGAPELRWSCERDGVRLRLPGLAPRWSTTERSGHAVLPPLAR